MATTDKIAVYAGTFNPLTHGHLWMIEQGSRLFDKLIVGLAKNASKKETFTIPERLEMLREATQHLPNVSCEVFEANEYTVRRARQLGATYLLRGLRNPTDFTYERDIRLINSDIVGHITTVFLSPPRELAEVSSSTIKSLIGPAGWEEVVAKLVPAAVMSALKERFK